MSYISKIKVKTVIDDKNYDSFLHDDNDEFGKGYGIRDYGAAPLGTFGDTFPKKLYIDSTLWPEMIEKADKNKAQPFHHKQLDGFDSLNQSNTNYCWGNAVIQGIHYLRAMNGLPHVPLSPASVCAPIKRYKNQGGWGSQALKYCVDHGVVPQSMWPANSRDKKYNNEETKAIRKEYQVNEFYELPDRSFHALVSCLLRGWPVAIGLNWWRHEVLACGVHIKGSDPESDTVVEIDNSWGTGWGDNGHGILVRAKATPDEAVCARVI